MFETIPPDGLPLPGGRYVLRRLLGRGGFGEAFLADDVALTRPVVIKLLADASDGAAREQFTREAQIAANVHHRAVVQVFDIGALPEGRPFFVMEWIDGVSLLTMLRDYGGVLPLTLGLRLMAETAEGLAAAHRKGVIHRDVKPENIIVTREQQARLIDFGIARKALEEPAAGKVVGTPRYVSPEQALANPLTGASDLYSLGCVLYLLLTGRTPFEGSSSELLSRHAYAPAPTLDAAGSGRKFTPDLERIVARLLAKEPALRFQDGDDVADALRQVARNTQLLEVSATTTTEAMDRVLDPKAPRIVVSEPPPALDTPAREVGVRARRTPPPALATQKTADTAEALSVSHTARELAARTEPSAAPSRSRRNAIVIGAIAIGLVSAAAIAIPRLSAHAPVASAEPPAASPPPSVVPFVATPSAAPMTPPTPSAMPVVPPPVAAAPSQSIAKPAAPVPVVHAPQQSKPAAAPSTAPKPEPTTTATAHPASSTPIPKSSSTSAIDIRI